MYLKKLTLRNFKCFEDLDIEFHNKLTVIAGVNGAGKTTVLDGVAIALSTMFTSIDGTKGRGFDKNYARLKAYSFGTVSDVQAQYPVSVSAMAEIDGKTIAWSRSLNTPKGNPTTADAKEMISVGKNYQERLRDGDANLTLPIIAYYGTGRLWDYRREKQSDIFESNTRSNGYVDSMDGTASIKLMMNWFAKMTVLKYQNNESGMGSVYILDAVFSAMEKCYSQITGSNDVKMQYNMGTKELDVTFSDADGNRMRIPINQLSDGYKCTISLVADIAYRMAVLNPQLLQDVCSKTHGVVLIDEVDLHLHPSWQQRILNDLTTIFPMVQFIVTTHAPEVINTVGSKHVRILRNLVLENPAVETYGRDANSILDTIMEVRPRPESVYNEFQQFYEALDKGELEKASDILKGLEEKYSDEPEVVAMRVQLDLEQM